MIPSVVKDLSRTRSKEKFSRVPTYNDSIIWSKAQKIQEHIFESKKNFFYPNFRFFTEGNEKIKDKHIKAHCNSFTSSKAFQSFKKSNLLYIYSQEHEECKCHDFWH